MVEICSAERFGWMALTVSTAFIAVIPWLKPILEHGKLMPIAGKNSGTRLAERFRAGVPKRYFFHFYLFGFVASALSLVDIILFGGSLFTAQVQRYSACSWAASRSDHSELMGAEGLACLLLLTIQVGRRLWECLTVTRWGESRMSFAGYVVGVLHYQLMVVTILAESPPLGPMIEETGLFSLGLGNAVAVAAVLVKAVKFRHAVAVGVFVIGSVRQHEAIKHLASLRVPPVEGQATRSTYAMPTKGWFHHVSSPHYFAELLIYISFMLMAGGNGGGPSQGYTVALHWVFSNQALVAAHTHAWYKSKFEDYPATRKRLIPGVW